MTSLTGQQIVTIFHILPNISRNTGNQAMKFGQLIKYIMRNIFLQGLCRKRGGRLVPNLKKKRFKVKHVISRLVLIYFGRPQVGDTIKTNFITFQTVDPEKWRILIFYKKVWD